MHETTTDASLYKARQRVAFKDLRFHTFSFFHFLPAAPDWWMLEILHLSPSFK